MTIKMRAWLFWPAAAGLAALFLWGLRAAPPVGNYGGPYGDVLNAITVEERHVTNVVSAVTFDYRGFDTLGEEFILFASVIGATVLLRQLRDEEREESPDQETDREVPASSDAVRVLVLGVTGPTVLFGIYIITHGHISPGGGFQGGVILATAPLLVYLAGGFRIFKRITSHALLELAEATGLAAYLLLGLAGMVWGTAFLENVLPLGTAGKVNSGGTILLLNVATGLEVSAGFVLLLAAFLEQLLEVRRGGDK